MKTGDCSFSVSETVNGRNFFSQHSPFNKVVPRMFNLPVFVGLDYHQNVIQVCIMEQFRKILVNQSVGNDFRKTPYKFVGFHRSTEYNQSRNGCGEVARWQVSFSETDCDSWRESPQRGASPTANSALCTLICFASGFNPP